MNRPTFFLSSTIYDFSDLRASVKYFLELQGCTVLASEFNDFSKPIEPHSYEACFNAIQKADYFVLFIGSRVGGWFDKTNQISITQQEYKEAYKLHKLGKLKIINFVRSDVWQLKEDRTALLRYLDNLEIDPGAKEQIVNHPSKQLSNAEFIINFINEVGRNDETKLALENKSVLPTGNWIHTFQTFSEVIDVLQTQIFLGQPIESVAIKKLLRRELSEILRHCLMKMKNEIYSPKSTIHFFYQEHTIPKDVMDNPYVSIKTKRWNLMSMTAIHLLTIRLHTLILPNALSSLVFMNFDFKTGTMQEEPIYEALFLLNEEIRELNRANTTDKLEVIFENSRRARSSDYDVEFIEIKTDKLLALLHLFMRWINVIDLSKSIIRYLDGEEFVMPKIQPKSPIPEMNEDLIKEIVTTKEVNEFIKNSV